MTEPANIKSIQVFLEIPDVACESIMSTAVEGGINYWARVRKIKYAKQDLTGEAGGPTDTADILYYSFQVTDREEIEDQEAKQDTAGLPEEDAEDMVEWHDVDYSAIRRGLGILLNDWTNAPAWLAAKQAFWQDHGEWMAGWLGHPGSEHRTASDEIWGGQCDADVCDLILQLGVFGEAVYG
jgi:hypothetical protein